MHIRRFVFLVAVSVLGCAGSQPEAETEPVTVSEPVTEPVADTAGTGATGASETNDPVEEPPEQQAEGTCAADASHCCMPDGRIVRPGGCQPSYPSDVQPATERNPDGTCRQIECYLRCLPETARIDAPDGPIPIAALRVGDRVYTREPTGARIVAPVLRVSAVPVTGAHTMIEVRLSDGRVVRASAGHPIARDGTTLGTLGRGDSLDGAEVVGVHALPYRGEHTWDLLPAGPTGEYWVDGVPVGSTLAP